jgi:hypothetical protein
MAPGAVAAGFAVAPTVLSSKRCATPAPEGFASKFNRAGEAGVSWVRRFLPVADFLGGQELPAAPSG